MKKTLAWIAGCLLHTVLLAQAPPHETSADMYLALRKLNVLGSVLYIAAHPDDENTRLIAFLSREKLYRTGYLSLTRGDGGQNLIGDEQGIELGLIRTQELLSARRLDGGEQFFSRAFDFGFSKSPEETFTKWDREKILSDVVWVIRRFQPDVIITRFPVTGEGGHGHHTASAILANEAFAAAADPHRFQEQLQYVKPWQARRVLWNTFNFGNTNTIREDQLKIDVGAYNPLLGKSYGEVAAESRSQHKSQGFGVPAARGESYEYFTATKGDQPAADLLQGVETSWSRVQGGAQVQKVIDSLIAAFDLLHPERSVPGLIRLYHTMNSLENGYWKDQKRREVIQLIASCSGLFMEATTSEAFAVQGDSLRITFTMNDRLGSGAELKNIRIDAFDSTFVQPLARNKNFTFGKTFFVPLTKPITQPYWLQEKKEEGYFQVKDSRKIGQPDVDPAYQAEVTIGIGQDRLTYTLPVRYKSTDPVKGEIYQPVYVVPAATVMSEPSLLLFRNDVPQQKNVEVQFNANRQLPAGITFMLRSPDTLVSVRDSTAYARFQSGQALIAVDNHWQVAGEKDRLKNLRYADSLLKKKRITPEMHQNMQRMNGGRVKEASAYVYAQQDDSTAYYLSVRSINYDHIPAIKYFFPDAVKIVHMDLKTYNRKIGYIVGAGDKVPAALEQMGYDVTLLTGKDISHINLKQFDAIITGVRAYNTNDWMNNQYDRLMRYVQEGGNLIVQYNTSSQIGPVRARIGPYPFTISRNRITDEEAKVTLLKPDHPVFNFPNKIREEDFSGWIQERSIYHAVNWDTLHYETVMTMNDPGEKQDAGSLIISKYGKGVFVYTGLVFFRELPAGVPGAYRLLANIIALNRKKAF